MTSTTAKLAAAAIMGASLFGATTANAFELPAGSSASGFLPGPFNPGPVIQGFLGPATGQAGLPQPATQDRAARLSAYVDGVNGYRAQAGLPAVTESEDLNAQAQAWADHMATTGEFDHDTMSCNGTICLSENIAAVGAGYAPQQVVDGWYNSEHHRVNMLRPNAIQVGHGEAVFQTGPHAGQLVSVERFYSQY